MQFEKIRDFFEDKVIGKIKNYTVCEVGRSIDEGSTPYWVLSVSYPRRGFVVLAKFHSQNDMEYMLGEDLVRT